MNWITIVVLCYNEEDLILNAIRNIEELEDLENANIIVSDGNSNDGTKNLINSDIEFIVSEPNKAVQMNTALLHIDTDVVWFVHADMKLPANGLKLIKDCIGAGFDGGGFRNEFDQFNDKIKRIGSILNLRLISNKEQSDKGIFYGDNGIFIKSDILREIGGVPKQSIMEDYELSIRLKKANVKMKKINGAPIIVSARRHIETGFYKTRMLWILIRVLYKWGVNPDWLRTLYLDHR